VATLERRAVPSRSCVVCRTSRDKRDLLRVVRAPDGTVRFDPFGRANGRGAYVCRDEACVAGATGRGGLSRALEARVPDDLGDQLLTAVREGGPHGT
jgi:predicted RNA-binding protein YlxR (DUF448 family)